MRNGYLISILVLAVLAGTAARAQDFSNKGKDFYIAYTGHIDGTASVMGLYLTSDLSTSGAVKVGAVTVPFTISANQVTTIFIGPNAAGNAPNTEVYNGQADGINAGAGIHVTAQKNIVVYAHIIRSARSGASLILPTPVLGKEYVVPSYQNYGSQPGSNYGYGQITVVAVEPNTTIEIVPKARDRNGVHPAGVPFQVTLPNAGDVYQLQSQQDADYSGSTVKSVQNSPAQSCKPIAVFSSTTWSAFDCGPSSSGGDNLYQQLFPTKSWGKRFVTAPFINKPYDIIRVYVTDPLTVVQKTESGFATQLSGLAAGSYYEFKTNQPTIIEADRPVSVAQYITSQTCGGGNSDPEMTLINPVEQTLTNITLFSAHANYVPTGQTQVNSHYINIVIPTIFKQTLRIDNNPPTGTIMDIPGSGYSYVQENVTNSSALNPVHNIKADTGFTAIVYGYGNLESYGYNAGTNLRDLSQYLSVNNNYATVDFPAACKNSPFILSMTFPYQPTEIKWIFGAALNSAGMTDVTLSNHPAFTSSSVVNGRTLYKYTLPSSYQLTAAGSYPIKITAENPGADGCNGIQDIDYELEVFDPPTADFTFTTDGCVSSPVSFQDKPAGTGGRPITHWSWNFGDGSTLTNAGSALHTYNGAGNFEVKYSVITDIGCKADTAVHTVALTDPPEANFSVDLISCAGLPITFKDLSTIGGGAAITKWTWDFGDGSAPVATNSTATASQIHQYAIAGIYTVGLRVETDKGCMSTLASKQVTVGRVPVAVFTSPTACVNDLAPFIDMSLLQDGNITGWQWDFGDVNADAGNLNSSAVQDPLHQFMLPGDYTAQLIVRGNNGCTGTVKNTFTINGAVLTPKFIITNAGSVCSNKELSIRDASQVDAGKILKVEIYWDAADLSVRTIDDNYSPGKTYTHSYPEFGSPATRTYTVRIDVRSGISCIKSYSEDISIQAVPLLHFDTLLPVCSNKPSFQFSQNLIQNGLSGTGTFTGTGVNTAGVFSPAQAGSGSHSIIYTYTAVNGCSNSVSQVIAVNPTPVADAGIDKGVLEGGSVVIGPRTTSDIPVRYEWTPADWLNNAHIANPLASPQTDYYYLLTEVSDKGCSASDSVFIKYLLSPVIPNIFSPNGDGVHDRWVIDYLDSYAGCIVQIFNRYGQAIYKIVNYSSPWDGKINGKDVPVGTYYYIIDPRNGKKPVTGYVDIIR